MSEEVDKLTSKVVELEAKLKAADDKEIKEAMEDEKKEAKKATFKATLDNMDEKQKAAAIKAIKAQDDEEMKKIANDYEKENMTSKKSKKAMEEEKDKKDFSGNDDDDTTDKEKEKLESKLQAMTARIVSFENERKGELITELIALKARLIPTLDEDIYGTKLSAKSFEDLQAMHNERKDEFIALKAAEKEPEKKHFGFKASTQNTTKLVGIEEIMNDGGIA